MATAENDERRNARQNRRAGGAGFFTPVPDVSDADASDVSDVSGTSGASGNLKLGYIPIRGGTGVSREEFERRMAFLEGRIKELEDLIRNIVTEIRENKKIRG